MMGYKRLLLLAFVLLSWGTASIALAQNTVADSVNPHAVQPERPTVATHAGTVARGWIEVEAGLERDKLAGVEASYPTPITVKYGIYDHLQLDLFIPHVTWQSGLKVGDIALGLKWRVLDDHPILGDFALHPSVKLPTSYSSSSSGSGTFDLGLLLISSRTIGDIQMDLNIGYILRTGDGSVAPKSASVWTASFSGPIDQSFGWTAECFGFPGTRGIAGTAPTIAILAGPTYLAREWLAFDLGVVLPLVGPQPFGIYAGGVWNIGKVLE